MKCIQLNMVCDYYIVTKDNFLTCLLIALNAKVETNKIDIKETKKNISLKIGDYIVKQGNSCEIMSKEKFDERFTRFKV